MDVAVRTVGSVIILDLDGRLTIEEDTRNLQSIVGELKEHNSEQVVLNMEGVRSLDCAGIGQIVTCYRKVYDQGGTLKLLNLSRRLRCLLEMTRLLTIIEAYDREPDVIRSFGGVTEGSPRWQGAAMERAFQIG